MFTLMVISTNFSGLCSEIIDMSNFIEFGNEFDTDSD